MLPDPILSISLIIKFGLLPSPNNQLSESQKLKRMNYPERYRLLDHYQYSHQNRSWSARPGRCSIALKHSSAGIAYPNSSLQPHNRQMRPVPHIALFFQEQGPQTQYRKHRTASRNPTKFQARKARNRDGRGTHVRNFVRSSVDIPKLAGNSPVEEEEGRRGLVRPSSLEFLASCRPRRIDDGLTALPS